MTNREQRANQAKWLMTREKQTFLQVNTFDRQLVPPYE